MRDGTPSATWSGIVTVVMTLLGWSSVPLFLRYLADANLDGWTSNGWRYGFSALLWAPLVLVLVARRRMPAGIWRAALIPGVINASGQVCFTFAHYHIDPGLVTFGLRTQLVFVAIGAYALFPLERAVIRTPGYLTGLVLVAVGTAATIGMGDAASGAINATGVVLAVLAGLGFASYGMSVRRCMSGFHPVVAFSVICQYTAIPMIGLMLIFGDRAGLSAFDLGPAGIGWLLLSAVIGIALGHVFYYLAIERLGVAVSSGVVQLQPFLTTLGSMRLFGEVLVAAQWFGGVAALLGAILMLATQHVVSRRSASRSTSESGDSDDMMPG